jgi:oxygen-independent coproporphyrinogen III oxidase
MPMFAAMPGIYIHIPFCRKACHYCNFHFSTSFKMKDELVAALLKEIEMQKEYFGGEVIETIYFGGGTPSALPPEDIEGILENIRKHHTVSPDAEVTLEANPDDINTEIVSAWKASGINRLSIGIQAFQDKLLHKWNRSHSAAQALASVSLVQEMGIENITADLIYGGPGLSDEDWISNIQRLIDSGILHISSYALTVETGTALFHQIQKGKSVLPDDDQANRQYAILQSMLAANGFEQYEVSNFAKPGKESKHNRSYWSGEYYLGIGPSAHSYNGISRQWNVSNNIKYIQTLAEDVIPFEKEELTDIQRYNEIVMTGLRTSKGIDMERIHKLGEKFTTYLDQQIRVFEGRGQVTKNDTGNWVLKPEYYFFADGMAAELFYT